MTGISRAIDGHDEQQARFVQVGPERRREALAILLTGDPQGPARPVNQFLDFAREQGLPLECLWLAEHDHRPRAAALVVPNAGRTGMLFLSPAARWPSTELAAELIRHTCASVRPEQATLVQCLLDHGRGRARQALEQAGFDHLATLAYMQRRSSATFTPLRPEEWGLTLHQWDPAQRDRFAQTILATYQDTRDCPGLIGLRHIDDIIAGHMASGTFLPELWYCLTHHDEPAGVMLLSEVPNSDALELVYLGLAPAWRGKGLARRLMQHTLGLAHRRGRGSVILAVDKQNDPAVRLYQDLGFRAHGEKTAMIYRVPTP